MGRRTGSLFKQGRWTLIHTGHLGGIVPGPRLGRDERIALREFGKALSGDTYLKGCGDLRPCGGVGTAREILDHPWYCRRRWLCPFCAHNEGWKTSKRFAGHLTRWTANNGAVDLLTLTHRHRLDDALAPLRDQLASGLRAVLRGSAWKTDQPRFGIRGYARVTEVVHNSVSGWNVHAHMLLFLDRPLSESQLAELEDRIARRFTRGVAAAGGQALRSGQDLRAMTPGTDDQLARYLSKGTEAVWSERTRTPFAILADVQRTGEGLDLWQEFTAAVTGARRKRFSTSQKLAAVIAAGPAPS